MNQERIGKFIAKCRKEKKLTQQELAEILGVTDKSISNWENARCMPDLSLYRPLCEALDITINDLISGEKIKKELYREQSEENIINTIEYTNKKVYEKDKAIGIILFVFGILLTLTAISIFPSESGWIFIYSIIGGIISLIGFSSFTKKLNLLKRLLLNTGYFIIFIIFLITLDYINVIKNNRIPIFTLDKETVNNMIIYKTPFYNFYRINYNSNNEYYIIDNKKEYDLETVPISPFNRDKSGIDNIIKYKNKYIGNNSNTGNLINSLPLSEYGYVFKIDSINLGLTIYYHITDWYINEDYYLEKSLLYNTVSIFMLIDNVDYINFNFSGKTYEVKREKVKNLYPDYDKIVDNFNKFVENKMNDEKFVETVFNKIFSE